MLRASKITRPGRERSANDISSSSELIVIGSPPSPSSHAATVAGGRQLSGAKQISAGLVNVSDRFGSAK
jgi:hypothetical protein